MKKEGAVERVCEREESTRRGKKKSKRHGGTKGTKEIEKRERKGEQ